jgi:pimeloyl-ACP methyl ester carboxylesterase
MKQRTSIEHEHADINGLRMHYAVAGRGNGPPVMLLHGFPESWAVWRRVMEDLAADHLVIAPDQRGYGLTTRPEGVEPYRIEHLVGDIEGLARHLEFDRFHLVSQDWGAIVGWRYLLQHPGRILDFTTINMTHPALFREQLQKDPAQQKASEYMLMFRSPAGEAALSDNDFAFLRHAVFAAARAFGAELSDEEAEAWIALWREPGALTSHLNWYRASELGPPDGQGGLGGGNIVDGLDPAALQVDAPVLFLRAEQDMYLLPSGMDGLHRYCKDVWIRRIAGADHWLTLEKPALVARYLREFFGLHRDR